MIARLGVLCLLLLCSGGLRAQTQVGFGLGYTYNTASHRKLSGDNTYQPSWRPGIELSFNFDIPLEERFSLHTGIALIQKGFGLRQTFRQDSLDYRLDFDVRSFYLQLPIAMRYRLPFDQRRWSLLGGLYLGLGLGGEFEAPVHILRNETGQNFAEDNIIGGVEFVSSINQGNIFEVDRSDNLYFRIFDLGPLLGAAYERGPWRLLLRFEMGILDINPPFNFIGVEHNFRRFNRSLVFMVERRF